MKAHVLGTFTQRSNGRGNTTVLKPKTIANAKQPSRMKLNVIFKLIESDDYCIVLAGLQQSYCAT